MSIRSKIATGLAALALAAGLGTAAGAVPASAASPSCGTQCINTYPLEYSGQQQNAPQSVLDVYQQGARVGQHLILFRSSNSDPAEDFSISVQGTVADFYAAGLVSSATAKSYGCVVGTGSFEFPSCANSVNDNAYELEYSPYGVDSGLCMGTASAAVSGEGVTLQPCGISSRTVWIQDTRLTDHSPVLNGFFVAINGSGASFSNPDVLTYPANANPVDKPRAQLIVKSLGQFTNPNFDDDNQAWTAFTGVLP